MVDFQEIAELYECYACGIPGKKNGRKQILHSSGNYYHPQCAPVETCPNCFLTKPCECDD